MSDIKDLPEPFKTQISQFKAKIDQQLVALASSPTTQVPAANEASYAIQCAINSFTWMSEMYEEAVSCMQGMMKSLEPSVTSLNSLNTRIEKGELLELPKVQERIDTAVNDALAKERTRVQLLGTRRNILATSNLPVPADDKVLEGEDPAFKTL